MPYHESRKSGIDVPGECRQFAGVELCAVAKDRGEREMRIFVRIAVSREMLAYGHDPFVFEPLCIESCLAAHIVGILAERTVSDDGILRITVYVEYRGEIDLYSHTAAGATHFQAVSIDKRVVGDGSQCHVFRKRGCLFQTHGETPFSVHRNHQGYTGECLRHIGEGCLVLCCTFREKKPSHMALFDK